MEKKIYNGVITEIKHYINSFLLTFTSNETLDIKAGQFISIYCDGLTFRRPFSVAYFENNKITLFVKLRGKGTDYLSKLKVNDNINFFGALGNGFDLKEKKVKSLLIGAGAGSAPIFFVKKKLSSLNCENLSISAFNTKGEIPELFDFDKIYTMDGSYGEKGSIFGNIEKIIQEYQPQVIYSCGPHIILKEIADLGIKYNIETQLAMEKVMACGIGVCRGCVIKVKKGDEIINKSICKDGPVFKGEEVVW